jgi:hypothetical protein
LVTIDRENIERAHGLESLDPVKFLNHSGLLAGVKLFWRQYEVLSSTEQPTVRTEILRASTPFWQRYKKKRAII